MNHKQTHLYQTLQSMQSAQERLQTIHRMGRRLRVEMSAGGSPDPMGSLRRMLRNGEETQTQELAMAGQCLRTMYPAANEPMFEVAL